MSDKRFRIAFSFAGEKRDFVSHVAGILATRFGEDKTLYDKYHEAEFARYDLGIYLPKLYRDESDLVVAVICPNYDEKLWTGWEWMAIYSQLSKKEGSKIMLSRFEYAHVDGLFDAADNTEPSAELDIDLGVGVQCADFDLGVTFTGHYTATDLHFRAFQFEIQPSGPPNDPPHGALPVPARGSSVFFGGAIADPGVTSGTYTLNTGRTPPVGEPHTGPMDACGYALILHVWDRTT